MVSLPRRSYLELSESLTNTVELFLERRAARELVTRVGVKMGVSTCRMLEAEHLTKDWTMGYFRENVKGCLEEVGVVPEVMKSDDSSITYSLHNCLFLELAVKPYVVCEVLHEGYD